MRFSELTSAETWLLSSVGASALLLTAFIMICLVRKECWLNKLFWRDGKKKRMSEDIICIRYPPDMYPSSVGVYRESLARSPEDEMARLFGANSNPYTKRDSTYSSMSESSSAYETPPHLPNSGSSSSPMGTITATTPVSPERALKSFLQAPDDLTAGVKQPFFTFALKYDEEQGIVHIDFLEARNLPFREYLNQPVDAFFALEIQPKKGSSKRDMMRYRFVTKTLERATGTCDYSEEKFLAQLPSNHLHDYTIRFIAFDQDRYGNPTELGQTTLTFDDFRDFTQHKLILSVSLKEPQLKRGEVLMGLSYLPTSERLSVTIVKVAGLSPLPGVASLGRGGLVYVRLILMRADTGKVLKRKKTTHQKLGVNGDLPLFNETLVFDMPPTELIQTVLLVLVCQSDGLTTGGNSAGLLPGPPLSMATLSFPPGIFVSEERRDSGGSEVSEDAFHYEGDSRRTSTASYGDSRRASNVSGGPPTTNNSSPEHHGEERRRSKDHGRVDVVGKVAFGYSVKNLIGKYHWEKMIKNPRNIVNEWHSLK